MKTELLERVLSKHLGPGPHPNGSPQSAHSGAPSAPPEGSGRSAEEILTELGKKVGLETRTGVYKAMTAKKFRELFGDVYSTTEGAFSSKITSVTMWSKMDFDTDVERKYLVVKGAITNKERQRYPVVGEFERLFEIDEEGAYVKHETLGIVPEFQGQGFAKKFNQEAEAHYKRLGIKKIKLHANIDVGGYAWAKAGYDWDGLTHNESELSRMAVELEDNAFVDLAERVNRGLDGEDDLPTPYELAMAGHKPGVDTWPGKQMMLNSSWYGVKYL